MRYKVVFTENTKRLLDNIIDYILAGLQSEQAASAVLAMIDKLEYMAGAIQLCDDPYLAKKIIGS